MPRGTSCPQGLPGDMHVRGKPEVGEAAEHSIVRAPPVAWREGREVALGSLDPAGSCVEVMPVGRFWK